MTETSQKEKWQPVSIHEWKPVSFTDRQWQEIGHNINLPEEARQAISECAGLYQLLKNNSSGRPIPSETAHELEAMHRAAEKLLLLYKEMGIDAMGAFMDTSGAMYKMHALEYLQNVAEQIQRISDWFVKTTDHVKSNRKNPGQDAGDVDWLVRRLDAIFHRFTGKYFDRGKYALYHVIAVFAVVDPDVTPGTIEAAIKRCIEQRREQSEAVPENRSPLNGPRGHLSGQEY